MKNIVKLLKLYRNKVNNISPCETQPTKVKRRSHLPQRFYVTIPLKIPTSTDKGIVEEDCIQTYSRHEDNILELVPLSSHENFNLTLSSDGINLGTRTGDDRYSGSLQCLWETHSKKSEDITGGRYYYGCGVLTILLIHSIICVIEFSYRTVSHSLNKE